MPRVLAGIVGEYVVGAVTDHFGAIVNYVDLHAVCEVGLPVSRLVNLTIEQVDTCIDVTVWHDHAHDQSIGPVIWLWKKRTIAEIVAMFSRQGISEWFRGLDISEPFVTGAEMAAIADAIGEKICERYTLGAQCWALMQHLAL